MILLKTSITTTFKYKGGVLVIFFKRAQDKITVVLFFCKELLRWDVKRLFNHI
jgi:hypothetical protein